MTRSRTTPSLPKNRREFALLFVVMLTVAAGNTGTQSVLPAIGRSMGIPDSVVGLSFSLSAILWVFAAPWWAQRLDLHGHRAMVLIGLGGFVASTVVCGVFLTASILGWISPMLAFLGFVFGRMIYGGLGSAAPPATQAMVAERTSRAERTKALTLLASAFGLGTIIGPALAPFFILPVVGMAGPTFVFALFGLGVTILSARLLTNDRVRKKSSGAAISYPSIGGQSSGASVTAAIAAPSARTDVKLTDPRIWPWMLIGLVMGHAQAMAGQTIGFLVIDRLHADLAQALQSTGIVLTMGAGAALLAQWGIIPTLSQTLKPRTMMLGGLALAALGCALLALADSLYAIAVAYALASLGFGFVRPGFTAGASLAVGQREQGAVAGRTTAVNGACFVLGPSLGVALYELWRPLPYLTAAAALVALIAYAWISLRPSDPAA